MRYIYNLTFKMTLSAIASLIIANKLNVEFATVAAVIAILSIQDDRKKALVIGKNRIFACIISIILSAILYRFIGQGAFIFSLFLIIFIPLASKLNISEGMVPAIVLSTHLLIAGEINIYWITNELLIMGIGIGTASIANIFMPSLEKIFNEDKEFIENQYRVILSKMSNSLITQTVDIDEEKVLKELEIRLKESSERAYKIANNKLFKNNSYYTDYINMRKNQFDIIMKMRTHFERFYMSFEQTHLMSKFTKKVAENVKDINDCNELLIELSKLKEEFKKMALPKTREEFENRAQLLQFLNDMEDLLNIKRNFASNYL
ncbi:aromatic acid exporter family protein [Clostridium carnis]